MTESAEITRIADATGFSEDAVTTMADAIRSGTGSMAQFSHPELGGSGQWSSGGMLMIGDMFNDALKARVRSLADRVASSLSEGGLRLRTQNDGASGIAEGGRWWPASLGRPSSSGAQNGRRYAVFPDVSRLAIETDGKVTVRDTGEHRISGVSQQQGGTSTLRFNSQIGSVDASDFEVVEAEQGAETTDVAAREPANPSSQPVAEAETSASEPERPATKTPDPVKRERDPVELLRRLAELKAEGILSEAEFAAKKTELLATL